jgi:hypothetical protein
LDVRADLGDESSKNTIQALKEDEKYERYRKYTADLEARESFKKTFDEVRPSDFSLLETGRC